MSLNQDSYLVTLEDRAPTPENIWAVACDFKQCGILTRVAPLKLRNSKLCSVNSLTVLEY